jgi:hypothetical protein
MPDGIGGCQGSLQAPSARSAARSLVGADWMLDFEKHRILLVLGPLGYSERSSYFSFFVLLSRSKAV